MWAREPDVSVNACRFVSNLSKVNIIDFLKDLKGFVKGK
jgi:hypothetical protein